MSARLRLPKSRNSSKRQLGATLVEYAFILALFLSLILGISGFGHALFTYHHLNNAAKEATRYATVRGYECDKQETTPSCAAVNSASGTAGPTDLPGVQAEVLALTPPSIDTSKLVVTACGVAFQPACSASGPKVCTANLTDPTTGALIQAAESDYPGCTVSVTVSYPYTFMFPFLPVATTTTPPCTSAGWCMSSTSEMIIIH